MPTEPAPTAENPWLPGLNGAALHSPSDGLCPARLGTFDRTEYSTIALNGLNGGERFDGICRYGNSDIGASITTYFYLTEGLSQTDEMRASVASIEDSRDARITQLPTSTCAGSISAVRPNPGANCIVLENESGSMREYVTMLTRNDWFTKLRASVPTADEDAMRITLAAIMEFNANQP
ncbi:MAG: hypothetical protein CMK09_01400 [Ponticaulis sp.]|nr:hypothetical protein [Ponticaulis sp.]|tara:strand:- start:11269 stop:11805 length:537 start_codon:yes stop_codon:yes gene_type:complete